jgi:subtilisin family serine protease
MPKNLRLGYPTPAEAPTPLNASGVPPRCLASGTTPSRAPSGVLQTRYLCAAREMTIEILPNLISVGAVNQAGKETGFISYGDTVVLNANGSDVESYVPGGSRLKKSGTSMASPNVANLAAKLIALEPQDLNLEGGARTEDQKQH